MDIQTFSPQDAGIPEKYNLEHKIVNSDVLSQKDIQEYADYIIGELKLLKNKSEQEKQTFVVDALNDNKILDQVQEKLFSGDLDIDAAENVVRRVRQALADKLKGKIDEKIYLVVKDASLKNIFSFRKNIINELVNTGSGEIEIYKDQAVDFEEHGRDMAEAFALLKKLPAHSNIVAIKEYDPASHRTVYEKLNMRDLKTYLRSNDDSKDNFLLGLKTIKDCLVGASYLAENGLVLQDIKLDNFGLVMEEKSAKGVLFDLEGLVKADAKMKYRLASPDYWPPEVPEKEDLKRGNGYAIKSAEMTYQFGLSLEEVIDFFKEVEVSASVDGNIAKKLEDLSKKMREKDPKKRIGLTEAKNELEEIIGKL
jgi:serine/threonine protein kinase